MTSYDLYGCKISLSDAKARLETLLGVQFEARESTYQGGEYFRAGDKSEEYFELKKNVDPFDGEPVEMNYPDFPILLYVNATERPLKLRDAIGLVPNIFILLRHEDL